MGKLESSLCRDLPIYNACKSKYDTFWEIVAAKVEEMTAVDDRRHTTGSVETGEAISAPDFYKKCYQEAEKSGLTAAEMLSLSWFKLQFWPTTTHSALNYTSHFSVIYMIQQRMVRTAHDDVHYAGAVYKCARECAVSICDLANFVCTGDKHEILVEEPVFPVAALPHGQGCLLEKTKSSRLLIMTSRICH